MAMKHLALCGAVLLAGCTIGNGGTVAERQAGYLYHDANHQGGNAQPSSPADLGSTRGVWLWPPAETDKPD